MVQMLRGRLSTESYIAKLTRPTLALIFVVVFMVYIFVFQPITLHDSGSTVSTTIDYAFLLAPSLLVSTCLYVSLVVGVVTEGKLTGAIVSILRLGSVPWGLALLSTWSSFPDTARVPVGALLGVVTIIQLRILSESVSWLRGERLFAVLDCVLLIASGYAIGLVTTGFLAEPPYSAYAPSIMQVSVWAFAATGISVLLGLFGRWLVVESWLSFKLSGGLPMRLVTFYILFTYAFLLRNPLSYVLSITIDQLAIIEWFALSVAAVLAFRSYVGYIRTSLVSPGDQLRGKHNQRVEWKKDGRFKELSDEVKKFVNGGAAEGLVARMVQVMSDSGGDLNGMGPVIAPIVNHRDADMSLWVLAWSVSAFEEKKRDMRMKDAEEAISRLESYLREAGRTSEINKGKARSK
jgi:hypothetical protein